MIENFRQLIRRLQKFPRPRVCVAAAAGEAALQTVRDALNEQVAAAVLIGDQEQIWKTARRISLDLNRVDVLSEPDPAGAVDKALQLIGRGEAEVLMRGQVDVAGFLAAAAGRGGAGKKKALSYLFAYEVPGYDRLLFVTGGGINPDPGFPEKIVILKSAVTFLQSLGVAEPKVAILSANEKVNLKMPLTVEAQQLAKAGRELLPGALLEGPVALDVAVSKEAARQKGIKSPVAAQADLLFAPNLEVGHILGEAIVHFARGKAAAVVLGAPVPLVLARRDEEPFSRLCSLALACFAAARQKKRNGEPASAFG